MPTRLVVGFIEQEREDNFNGPDHAALRQHQRKLLYY